MDALFQTVEIDNVEDKCKVASLTVLAFPKPQRMCIIFLDELFIIYYFRCSTLVLIFVYLV